MLIADDRRRYVDANRAACLLLRLPREAVCRLRIDDLTPPEHRGQAERLWAEFLAEGGQRGTFELLMPDGPRMLVDYSATANVEPGRHLSMLLIPTADDGRADGVAGVPERLTAREREVLALIAMGHSGAAIALGLGISPATVETHVRHCLGKLAARNRAHAIALGLQHGEIELTLGA
jgi:DNA-binding CsgD family transcriptional regulator